MLQSVTVYYKVLQSITEYSRLLQSISSASTWTNFWACFLRHSVYRAILQLSIQPTNQPTNQVGYNITCQVCSNLRLSEEEVAWGREGWRWRGWVLCGRSTKNTCYKCDQNFSCWSSPLLASFSGPRLVTRALEGVEDRLALPMVAARRVLHNREHHHDYQDYNHYFFSGHFNSFPLYFPI